jgi:hypothetical protein
MDSELLITTNGFKGTWFAIEYGAWLAEILRMKISLLGINESRGDRRSSPLGGYLRALC